jgi:hypothetical protein
MEFRDLANTKIKEVIELVKRVKKTGRCGEQTLKDLESGLHKIFGYGWCEGYNEAKDDIKLEYQETL